MLVLTRGSGAQSVFDTAWACTTYACRVHRRFTLTSFLTMVWAFFCLDTG